MKHSVRSIISGVLSLTTAFVLTGAGLASTAYAGTLKSSFAEIGDVRSGNTTNHKIYFSIASNTTIKKVSFQYANSASSGSTVPTNLSTTSATKGSVTVNGTGDTNNWTLDASVQGTLTYTATTAVNNPATSMPFVFDTNNIHNNTTTGGSQCDAVTDSDSCWIRITTYDGSNAVIDTSTVTYTVINEITVTATIDPILTFTVGGVNASTTNDANQGGATSVTTTSTTIPFGNVTVGSSKIAQQSLAVQTNASNGYIVYHKFVGGGGTGGTLNTYMMYGSTVTNHIDPFAGGTGTGWTDDGGGNASGTWASPTGTAANTNSAWLGVRSSNSGVSGFGTANKYSPPYIGTTANTLLGKKVMNSSGPDNGTVTYVSFQIEANAYQPSDTYTGKMVYNVVASY